MTVYLWDLFLARDLATPLGPTDLKTRKGVGGEGISPNCFSAGDENNLDAEISGI
jgi:hypothetical protein